jgi:hypothetical protein
MEASMAKPSTASAAPNEKPSGSPSRKPVERFRDGPVHVSIWENDGPRGAFRTASFELRYKNKQQEWQTSHSYGAADLEHVEKAAREARTRIDEWHVANKVRQDNASPG